MNDICRLCCSPSFVNNNIFDEENALYLKMSLYLPIKVFKNDRLPQKVCDKCSCKVNDFYQFCNETIEVQERLRAVLVSNGIESEDIVDLTRIKENASPVPISKLEQSTQTEWALPNLPTPNMPCVSSSLPNNLQIKEEPRTLSPIKEESDNDRNHFPADMFSDEDNISLLSIKKRKKSKKEVNGVKKRGPKKKKLKEWESIINGLPDSTTIIGPSLENDLKCAVKEEVDQKPVDVKVVKTEPSDMEAFNCCICFYQCFSRGEMLQHYRQHALESPQPTEAPSAPPPPDTTPLRCPRCRKSLAAGDWSAHWSRHWQRDRRPFRCALCEKSFRDAHQILKHGQTHKYGAEAEEEAAPANKRFICDLCPEGFVYMRYLLAHRSAAHPDALSRALVLRCSVCSRQFAHLNSLRRHLRAHSGERNHLCNVCGKALSSREHLKFHIRIHTGYKPNVCKTCGKGFVKKCNLTLHERVHSGERPHVCASCGKAFSQRSTLVIHERYHSGARPYACALCGRAFVAKGLLSMHLKSTCIWYRYYYL